MRQTPLLLITFALVATAPAQTLFTTLGPDDSYQQNVGRSFSGIDNSFTHIHSDLGWQFVSATTDTIRTIQIAARHYEGTNAAKVRIYTNSNSNNIGTALGEWQLYNMPSVLQTAPPQVIDASASNILLNVGQKYWLVLSPTDDSLYAAWMDNSQGIFGRMAWSNGVNNFAYVDNMPLSAFSINAVPEPATLAILTLIPLALKKRLGKL